MTSSPPTFIDTLHQDQVATQPPPSSQGISPVKPVHQVTPEAADSTAHGTTEAADSIAHGTTEAADSIAHGTTEAADSIAHGTTEAAELHNTEHEPKATSKKETQGQEKNNEVDEGPTPGTASCVCKGEQYKGCNRLTATCVCDDSLTGNSCDQCATGYYNYNQETKRCKPCNCSTVGSSGCSSGGECLCKDGYQGATCYSCQDESLQYTEAGGCSGNFNHSTLRCYGGGVGVGKKRES